MDFTLIFSKDFLNKKFEEILLKSNKKSHENDELEMFLVIFKQIYKLSISRYQNYIKSETCMPIS